MEDLTAGGRSNEDKAVRRRALLTGSGVVVAGVVGAGAAAAAFAGGASAATGNPVLQGSMNAVGTDQPTTEIAVTNNTIVAPAVTATNAGTATVNTFVEASPALRLTQSTAPNPSSNGTGGDMVATFDGNLWFTHDIHNTLVPPFAAVVHTDANSNSFVPLKAPVRVLDTRSSAGRKSVLDPTGKFDSTGRLLAGKTIHIDLTGLVIFADAVTANLTVTGTANAGFLTLWSGVGTTPNASSINFAGGATLSNLTVSGVASFTSPAKTDTIAIFAHATTHVILDVGGFAVGSPAQVNPVFLAPMLHGVSRAERARQALAARRNPKW